MALELYKFLYVGKYFLRSRHLYTVFIKYEMVPEDTTELQLSTHLFHSTRTPELGSITLSNAICCLNSYSHTSWGERPSEAFDALSFDYIEMTRSCCPRAIHSFNENLRMYMCSVGKLR